ncbi:MAG: class I SAM-dependent methyltransferase [Halobacteriaceae archaeon]
MHDVGTFHRLARLYDLLMPPASPDTLAPGLAVASGSVDTVVDVGGGTGRAVSAIRDAAIVVDAAPGMGRAAQRHGHAAIRGRAESLPIADGHVDAILIVDALHHFEDAPAAIDAAFRAIRPGGVLVVREFDPATLRGRFLVVGEHLLGFDSQFFTSADLLDLFEAAGFDPTVVDAGFGYTVAGHKPEAQP